MIKKIYKLFIALICIVGIIILIFIPMIVFWGLRESNYEWNIITFFEAYITYFGTVFLGVVALYQNIKLNKENRKARIVEKVQFLSFVKCEFDLNVPAETDLYGITSIFLQDENTTENSIYIMGTIKNLSKYPINKLSAELYRKGKKIGKKKCYESYNFTLEQEQEIPIIISIFLLENKPDIIEGNYMKGFNSYFSYDIDKFAYLIEDDVNIVLTFTNVFGNIIKGKISFLYNEPGGYGIDINFKLDEIHLD